MKPISIALPKGHNSETVLILQAAHKIPKTQVKHPCEPVLRGLGFPGGLLRGVAWVWGAPSSGAVLSSQT